MKLKSTEPTDAELVSLLQQGDHTSLEQIYFRYADFLFQFSIKRLNDRETAADLIQELFTKLWYKRETLKVNGNLQAYLTFCLRNQIIDHYSHQQVKHRYLQVANSSEADYGTLELITYNETRHILDGSINSLPEKMRQVLMLNKFKDRSIDEIADELNISRQTVKNQLGMAVKRLRMSLGSLLSLTAIFHLLQK